MVVSSSELPSLPFASRGLAQRCVAELPRLIVVTSVAWLAPRALIARLAALAGAARPGSLLVQLRDRELPVRERLALGRELRRVTREARQLFSVNDRLDLARLLGADGAHLPEAGVSPSDARALLGPRAWLSVASHGRGLLGPSSAGDALDGLDYVDVDAVLLSPILAPRKGAPALELAALGEARRRLPAQLGLYALGGVDAQNARACLESGADGVAVMGAALGASSGEELLDALGIAVG